MPRKPKFPREIVGRALADDGFRAYLLTDPEDCLHEHGYGDHATPELIKQIKKVAENGKLDEHIKNFKNAVNSSGGPD